MAATFLHGVESLEIDNGARPIRVVKSSVVALIGTAPVGPVNQLVQCLSDRDAAQFGTDLPGFSMPAAFAAIYTQSPATVLAINVLDPDVHKAQANDEAQTFAINGRVQLANPAVQTLTLKSKTGSATYVEGTDYQLDKMTGTITRLGGGGIAPLAEVTASYAYSDPSLVTAADIIGAVSVAEQRTGLKLFDDAYSRFGYFPKLFIAPGFAALSAVSTELIALAENTGGMALIDAPIGTTPSDAINGRGPDGTINFETSSERAILCYPHVEIYDAATNATRLAPFSQYLAGAIVGKDLQRGYWWSPSNTEINGIVGMERPLTARVDDPQSEVNALNEVGITTIFNSFGTGFRTWGNRTAAWPTVTHIKNFINVRRTKDIIDESIRFSSLQFIDRPINGALIDAVVESVNQFMRKLTGDGALLGGECWFDPERNPATNLELGNAIFSYKLTVPPPFERGTFETEFTDEYLVTLGGQ